MPKFTIRIVQHITEAKEFEVEAESKEAAEDLDPDAFADEIGSDDFVEVTERSIEWAKPVTTS